MRIEQITKPGKYAMKNDIIVDMILGESVTICACINATNVS